MAFRWLSRYMAEILLIPRKTLNNQSINQSINRHDLFYSLYLTMIKWNTLLGFFPYHLKNGPWNMSFFLPFFWFVNIHKCFVPYLAKKNIESDIIYKYLLEGNGLYYWWKFYRRPLVAVSCILSYLKVLKE